MTDADKQVVANYMGWEVGDKVKCYVEVLGKMVEMHNGIVTEQRNGYYMVDRMSLHGGAPWICAERFVSKEEEK